MKAICLWVAPFLIAGLLLAVPSLAAEREPGGVTFNFVDVELPAIAKFVSDVTGKNLIFDERLKGKVNVIAPTRLKAEDAYTLFVSVLELKGFTLLPSGVNAYKIVPLAEVRRSGIAVGDSLGTIDESFVVRLVSLENVSADEALKFLKPVISKEGHIAAFDTGNMILVVDSGLNMQKVLSIVGEIDKPPLREEPEIVYLRHAGAEDVADMLNAGVDKRGKKPEEVVNKAVADRRLNAVVLFGTKGVRESMKRLVSLLDTEAQAHAAQGTINVFFLENADAEELAEVLKGLTQAEKQSAKQKGGKSPQQQAESPFEAVSGIVITPDKATNSLIVVASPTDYQRLSDVIRQLDVRRRQIFVEAMIVEASLDKLKDLGSSWRVAVSHDDQPVFVGGFGEIDDDSMGSILTGLSGFSFGGAGNYMTVPLSDGTEMTVPGFAALFSLSLFDGVVKVLSSPQLLTTDNAEAEILVGENVPFISQYDVTDEDEVIGSIERKDVGITLRITPQITKGDYVRLDIYQEISSLQEVSESVYTTVGPTTTKRSTKTTVVVRDSQTVVIGGLMQDSVEKSETKMPLLGDLPVLGWLFKYRSEKHEKTNLLVFLNPHIIKDDEDLGALSRSKRDVLVREGEVYPDYELLVRFRPAVDGGRAIDLISRAGAEFVEFKKPEGLYRVRVPKGIEKGSEAFIKMPEVAAVTPNYGLPAWTIAGAGSPAQDRGYATGEILVRFSRDIADEAARRAIEDKGGAVIRHYEGLYIYLVRLGKGQGMSEAVELYRSIPGVEYVEPNDLLGF